MANGPRRSTLHDPRSAFPGFPPEALDFFRKLRRNNRREWFQPRKHLFEEHIKFPMAELVGAINARLMRFAPAYVTEPGDAIYRIYRDTRFSHDKTPYKTHIAASFPRRGLVKHACAGLYFSVSDEEIEVAGGVYMPTPEELRAIRLHLLEHADEFRRLARARSLKALMGETQGEQLTRVPKGFPADHPAADLVRYRQWLWFVPLDAKLATTPKLIDELSKRFEVMAPAMEFLNAPLLASRKRAAASFAEI